MTDDNCDYTAPQQQDDQDKLDKIGEAIRRLSPGLFEHISTLADKARQASPAKPEARPVK